MMTIGFESLPVLSGREPFPGLEDRTVADFWRGGLQRPT